MSKAKQTKAAQLRTLLKSPSGSDIQTICTAMGWQAHSARASLSTLRKNGCTVERCVPEAGGAATYHLVTEPKVQA
ncbi:DUF3489 domain-containing protein [Marimonas lutisalis]|uniref:DUF3489 domain-containing protein n=1 Tax=Marimonas lutisalis TaxID=2545756 RepID=UPI0010F9C0DF|nr:DUF3489 domain-containing protein [Marimonas lutisalis]